MGQFKHVYNSGRWKRLRSAFLRSHPLCRCGRPATDVDHVVPIRDGVDPYDDRNLQALCHRCHSMKTSGGEHLHGCDADGMPVDPNHPWARQESGASEMDVLGGVGF